MGRWQNFSIWRGRFPHWRADDVRYYVSFPHRTPLTPDECDQLFAALLRFNGRKLSYFVLSVVPEKTEALFETHEASDGEPFEFSDVFAKAQKRFVKKSPQHARAFYAEVFDRIVRDDDEFSNLFDEIITLPERSDHIADADHWDCTYVAEEIADAMKSAAE
jgi:hypothetical protein